MMGSVIGTPAYMPPEQAAGRLDELGPASDVYSLGATLYYVLTGNSPFRGKKREVLNQVQQGDFAGGSRSTASSRGSSVDRAAAPAPSGAP